MVKETMIEPKRRPLTDRTEGLLPWSGRWGLHALDLSD